MAEIAGAVKQVREHLGESQQAFSNRLGLSLRAVANYEKDRKPIGKALMQLWNLAEANGLVGPAKVFQEALSKELGHGVVRISPLKTIEIPPGKEEDFEALMSILVLGGKRNREALAEWNRISAPIKAANRAKNARAALILGLSAEIRRRVFSGESDDDIVRALPAWQPEVVKTLAASMRGLGQLSKGKGSK